MDTLDELRGDLATATRILARHGLIAPFGHVSARIPGEDGLIAILADSHAKNKNDLVDTQESDVVIIDLNGELVKGDKSPPGERFIHTEAYRARPDAQSVVHAHPVSCVGLSVVGESVSPLWLHSTVFAEGVPIFREAVQIETPEHGRRVAELLAQRRALLLKGHGTVTVGEDIRRACIDTLNLERTAALQIAVAPLGVPEPIPPAELNQESLTQGITARGYYAAMWDHLTRETA